MHNDDNKRSPVRHVVVTADEEDQRIDNFLINQLKGMPRTRVYRLVRKGEVRVNSKRVSAFYKLKAGDNVRIPPVYLEEKAKELPPSKSTSELLASRIIYEDDLLLIINKPCGMSVHVGSTVRMGVIEAMRHMYPNLPQLELAHRLDSETSGCLVLAKKRKVLREIHELLREGKVKKTYMALTKGKWSKGERVVDVPLYKDYQDGGKHVVEVRKDGKSALTIFSTAKEFKGASLMEVALHTGRTHQIRVHAQHQGHPIAGDDRYGDEEFNQLARKMGLKRMFLHSYSIEFILPSTQQQIKVVAPLDDELKAAVKKFEEMSRG